MTTLATPRAANVTVKLEASERNRLKSLATAKKRTPHYLMKEAIEAYLTREEWEQSFIADALVAREHFRETGLHITDEELGAWADAVKNDRNTPFPECHV